MFTQLVFFDANQYKKNQALIGKCCNEIVE